MPTDTPSPAAGKASPAHDTTDGPSPAAGKASSAHDTTDTPSPAAGKASPAHDTTDTLSPAAGRVEDSTDRDESAGRLFAERAYHELRDRIVTLRLPPGTVLREDALMRELEIGRTPLREAVKRLALENLVAVQPRRGTFVSAVEAADIVHITEVRAELEGYAAELAARRMDGEARRLAEELRREIAELERTDDQDGLMRFDERIHRFTWEASGNPYLIETLERYFTLSLRIWYLVLDRVPGLGHAVHDQTALIDALIERDGARARAVMREHVLAFQREIIAAFSRG